MTSTYEDRTLLAADVAIKAPCRAATTAAITLSGLQTIDGIALVANDRVLVKNQASGSANGIYLASTGSWTRTSDFDGSRDVVDGTLVLVRLGTASALALYECSCATSPAVIGTTSLTFNLVSVVVGNAGSFTTLTASVSVTTPIVKGQAAVASLTLEALNGATGQVRLRNNGIDRWYLETTGDLNPFADNTYSAGTAALRLKQVFTPIIDTGTASSGILKTNNGTTVLTWANDLSVKPTGLLDLSTATAGQVKFPAAQNASGDANTLDDYEEGTWTPSVGGTATYNTQTGHYTKIGNKVSFWALLTINAIGTGSTTVVSGLPFTVGVSAAVTVSSIVSSVTAIVSASASAASAGTSITITSRTAASASDAANAIFQNGTSVILSGFYKI